MKFVVYRAYASLYFIFGYERDEVSLNQHNNKKGMNAFLLNDSIERVCYIRVDPELCR